VTWKKNNKPLTRWHYKDIEFLDNEQTLKINPSDWIQYNGTYSFTIKNKLGNKTIDFDLLVNTSKN